MIGITRSEISLVLSCLFLCNYISFTAARTYQLNYEAIISPDHVVKHAGNPRNQNMEDGNVRSLPPTMAEDSIIAMGQKIFQFWIDVNYAKGKKIFSGEQLPMDFSCFPGASQTCHPPSTICVMSHTSKDFSFRIHLETYEAEGAWQDYFDDSQAAKDSFTKDDKNNYDSNDCPEVKVPVALRVDSTITTPGTHARDFLTQAIPVLNTSIEALMVPTPVWSINERISPIKMMKYLQNDHEEVSVSKESDSSASLIQNELPDMKNRQSVESVILSNPALVGRLPIYSTSSLNNYNKMKAKTSSSAVQLPKLNSIHTDIWQYHEAGMDSFTRALFFNSTLRAITNTAGSSHAEAFIHPAMISHEKPERVAVISDFPLPYIKELLKYEDIQKIDIVGADWDALDASRVYLPQMDDCSNIQDLPEKCLDSLIIEANKNQSLQNWLDLKISTIGRNEDESDDSSSDDSSSDDDSQETDLYDVVYLDVTVLNSEEWLSTKIHRKLRKILDSESVVVINTGFSPSMDRNYQTSASDNKLRDLFLTRVTKSASLEDGIGYGAAFVYDEELAHPLDSSFIMTFESDSDSYARFTRDSSTAIDLDIGLRFRKHLANMSPLVVYDGTTHRRYSRPTRSWEKWFCQMKNWSDTTICDFLQTKLFDKSLQGSKTTVKRDELKGRSLTASSLIKKGNFIIPEDIYNSIHIDEIQWDNLNQFVHDFPDAEMYSQLRDFFYAYGFESASLGRTGWSVSLASNNTFTNHACTPAEINVGSPNFHVGQENEDIMFSPALSRRPEMFSQFTVALRDIKEGEEIMMDYTHFREEGSDDIEFISFLQRVCTNGDGLVPID